MDRATAGAGAVAAAWWGAPAGHHRSHLSEVATRGRKHHGWWAWGNSHKAVSENGCISWYIIWLVVSNMAGLLSISYMGCHPKPIDEVHHFSRWLLHHQPVMVHPRNVVK